MSSYDLLKNKNGIIFGAFDEKSIAWQTAIEAKKEGAEIILTNLPAAIRIGKINELAKEIDAPIIPCNVSDKNDIESLIDKSMLHFNGPFDFLLHSVGMSYNIRKKNEYTNLDYDYYFKTLDVSALSLHKILQTCFQKNALNDSASVVALSFIAAQRVFPYYNDMSDAKAVLESIVRNFGYYYGKRNNVRINSVSQSPTPTNATVQIENFEAFRKSADEKSPLGNASAPDCAKFICMLFSDYSQKVTMQHLFHDGGFHAVGQ